MTVWLSTAPTEPLTHWYQVRCLFQSPLFAKAGDTLSGTCLLIANKRCELSPRAGGGRGPSPRQLMATLPCPLHRQSYDISIVAQVDQTGSKSSNLLDLKNPFFRYDDGSLACVGGAVLAHSPSALPMGPSLPQIHRHDTLAPAWLPLHIPLGEHVEHGQHLQPQQWDGCGW